MSVFSKAAPFAITLMLCAGTVTSAPVQLPQIAEQKAQKPLRPQTPAVRQDSSVRVAVHLPMFPEDKRLSALVSLQHPGTTVGSLLKILTRDTRVKLLTEGVSSEMESAPIALYFDKRPLREVMEGIVALNLAQWKQNDDKTYTLYGSSNEYSIYLPRNQWQKERNEIGKRFAENLARLSPEDQAKIAGWNNGEWLPLSGLPASLQPSLQQIGESKIREGAALKLSLPFDQKSLGSAGVRVTRKPGGRGLVVYSLSYGLPNVGSMGFSVNNYEDLLANKEQSTRMYNPRTRPVISPANAVSKPDTWDARLDKMIELNAGSVTMERALRLLSQKSGLSMVTESSRLIPSRMTVNYGTLSVREALDRLAMTTATALHRSVSWEWEFRPDVDLIVVRSSTNPASAMSKNNVIRTMPASGWKIPGRPAAQRPEN